MTAKFIALKIFPAAIVLIFSAALLASPVSAKKKSKFIVGKWSKENQCETAYIEFRKKGKMVSWIKKSGQFVKNKKSPNGRYTYDGKKKLILEYEKGGKQVKQINKLKKIDANRFRLKTTLTLVGFLPKKIKADGMYYRCAG